MVDKVKREHARERECGERASERASERERANVLGCVQESVCVGE